MGKVKIIDNPVIINDIIEILEKEGMPISVAKDILRETIEQLNHYEMKPVK